MPIEYIHVFGSRLLILCSGRGERSGIRRLGVHLAGPRPWRYADLVHHGGFTLAVDTDRRAMAIAVCSTKDQFSRKEGVRIATRRLQSTSPHPHHVLIPPTKGKNSVALRTLALETAFETWLEKGWDPTHFQVHFILQDVN